MSSLMRIPMKKPALDIFHFFLLIAAFGLSGCGASYRLSNQNLNNQFSFSQDVLSPECVIFHSSADSSKALFRIPPMGLLYILTGEQYRARMNVSYQVFTSYQETQPLDSGSTLFEISSKDEKSAFNGELVFPLRTMNRLLLRLVFRDLNRATEAVRIFTLSKNNDGSASYFYLGDSLNRPLYRPYVFPGETFRVLSAALSADSLWLRAYFRDFPLATLPFRVIDDPVFEMRADSASRISTFDLQRMQLTRSGIYFLQADTLKAHGFTLFCMDDDFPVITRADQLVESTRYITTRKEYNQLRQAGDKKEAIDGFWMDIGGSREHARDLIRAYYSRVQDANRLFTSYLEGWKTDRGMIYMIFGKPKSIYRDNETEQWTYTSLNGIPEVVFIFRKMNNPFSENDYALIRQSTYENVWYLAVDLWRQGRIVNEN